MKDLFFINNDSKGVFGNSNGVMMDVSYNASGNVEFVTGKQRLAQSIQKMLITSFTEKINKRAPYGTYIPDMVGSKSTAFFGKPFIITTIATGLTNYKNMQKQVSNEQDIPDDELYRGLVGIQVNDIRNNPTYYGIVVKIQNEKEETIDITMSLPKG